MHSYILNHTTTKQKARNEMINTATKIKTTQPTLVWSDLFTMMERDNGGRWTAKAGTPAAEYINSNGYRTPSRAWPHSHSHPLLTKKFAKWLQANHPVTAATYDLRPLTGTQNAAKTARGGK